MVWFSNRHSINERNSLCDVEYVHKSTMDCQKRINDYERKRIKNVIKDYLPEHLSKENENNINKWC